MSWPVLRAGLELLLGGRPDGECHLSLLGGEPLLQYPLIRRAIEYVARRGPRVRLVPSLVTNGTLLDARRLRFLLANNVRVTLSFDGLPAAQDHRARGTFLHLDRLLSLLRRQYSDHFHRRIGVTVVVHAAALECLADSFEYLLRKQVREIRIAPAMGSWAWRITDIERLERQFARIFDVSKRHYESTGRVPMALFRNPELDLDRPIGEWCCGICSARSPVVDVDGRVYPCAMLIRSCQTVAPPPMGRRLGRLSLGHIGEPGLADRAAKLPDIARELEIFARQDRKWSSYGKCDDCPSVGVCVICPIASRKDRRVTDPLQVSDFQCAFNRVAFDYRRRFPCQPAPPDAV